MQRGLLRARCLPGMSVIVCYADLRGRGCGRALLPESLVLARAELLAAVSNTGDRLVSILSSSLTFIPYSDLYWFLPGDAHLRLAAILPATEHYW